MTTPRPRKRPQHLESIEQRLFVQRVRVTPNTRDLPACAIPNGGRRGAREAAILKGEGVSAGAPDWVLFVPAGPYHGLALEFKSPTGTGRVSVAQRWWHDALRAHGYAVTVVTTAADAWAVLMWYLHGQPIPTTGANP